MLSLFAAALLTQLPDAGTELDLAAPGRQTVVTGTRTERKLQDAVIPIEVITRAQIEAIGARDLGQLLQNQQGVELEYTFRGTGISLQGLGPEYVLVLIDGERIAGRLGSTLDLSRFSLREVERVEIVKGPAAALYGSEAIAGVINLITRKATKPLEVEVRAQTGYRREPQQDGSMVNRFDPDVRGHVGGKLGIVQASAGGGYQARQPYDLDPSTVATSGAGYSRWDVDGDVLVTPTDQVSIGLKADYLRRDIAAVDIAPSGAIFDRRERSEQFNLSSTVKIQAAPRTGISLRGGTSLFRDQLQQDQRGATFLDTYGQSVNRLWQFDAQLDQRIEEHQVSVGGAFLTETLSSDRLSEPGKRYRGGAFVQDEWDLFNPAHDGFGLKLMPGIRVDIDSQFGAAPSPRIAVKVDPSPDWTLRASYGWGFRAPTFTELYLSFENTSVGYVVVGNPALKAETSYGINLAIDYRLPLTGWVASAALFHTDLINQIAVNSSGGLEPGTTTRFAYENIATSYAQGLEASMRMRLSKGAYFDLGYTLTDAHDVDKNRPIEGRSIHKVNAQLSVRYRPAGLELVVRGTYFGPKPFYTDANGDLIDEQVWVKGYVNLDAQLTYRFWKERIAVFAGMTNIVNSGDVTYVPQPPRTFIAGAQVQY